jgi:hypothetical protein
MATKYVINNSTERLAVPIQLVTDPSKQTAIFIQPKSKAVLPNEYCIQAEWLQLNARTIVVRELA